jgi:hypothetical protein
MAKLEFNIVLIAKGEDKLAELQARAADLSPVFEQVIEEWAEGNKSKFNRAKGRESSGIEQDTDCTWEPLQSRAYQNKKREKGYPDWLMHGTGELVDSLTDTSGFINVAGPTQAAFGTPWSTDNEVKVRGNWMLRPVVFLNNSDTRMIDRNVQDYFSDGPDFANIRLARGFEAMAAKQEMAQWGIDFAATVGG